MKIEELVIGNDLLPFGDTNEMLLSEALSQISGLKSLSARAESKGRILLTPSSLERKQTKGLIFEEENKVLLCRSMLEGLLPAWFYF